MNMIHPSFLHLDSEKQQRFQLLTGQGPFELRLYYSMVCAKVTLAGTFKEVWEVGKVHLHQYLEGNNFKVSKIMNPGPFYQLHKANQWELGVILPQGTELVTAPKPIDKLIRLENVTASRAGVLKYKGEISPERVLRKSEELKRWLWKNQIQVTGPLAFFRYEAHQALPFLRHHEILLNVA